MIISYSSKTFLIGCSIKFSTLLTNFSPFGKSTQCLLLVKKLHFCILKYELDHLPGMHLD